MPCLSGIYRILDELTGQYYIGFSTNIKIRWNKHKHQLRNNMHHNKHLQNLWNRDKEKSFEFLVINHESDYEKLRLLELYYITNNINETLLLNINKEIAQTRLGVGMSKELKLTLSNYAKTRIGSKNTFYGKHHSENTKLILANKNTKFGKDNPFYGKSHSDETKQSLSKANKGKGIGQRGNKPFEIDGTTYMSLKSAAESLHISVGVIRHRLITEKFKNYKYCEVK